MAARMVMYMVASMTLMREEGARLGVFQFLGGREPRLSLLASLQSLLVDIEGDLAGPLPPAGVRRVRLSECKNALPSDDSAPSLMEVAGVGVFIEVINRELAQHFTADIFTYVIA
ncbi:hypothetical protein [Carnimonas nigrificans]|uniref:hypothetical protein n=1 Tax=Carnimonas nigrificans TaxID=64323 RepID=UPI000687986A|nr:hypothetical protein [Carnimonas nigrificans]